MEGCVHLGKALLSYTDFSGTELPRGWFSEAGPCGCGHPPRFMAPSLPFRFHAVSVPWDVLGTLGAEGLFINHLRCPFDDVWNELGLLHAGLSSRGELSFCFT